MQGIHRDTGEEREQTEQLDPEVQFRGRRFFLVQSVGNRIIFVSFFDRYTSVVDGPVNQLEGDFATFSPATL